MGSLCSKSSTHSGGHTLVGSSSATPQSYGAATRGKPAGADGRSAAAAAAENRRKAEQARGTNAANPNKGQLSAKLQASKARATGEEEQPERLVWD